MIFRIFRKIVPNKIARKVFVISIIWIVLLFFTGVIFGFDRRIESKGQLGDYIGGLSAPIINLFGAILVYLSFEQQRKANLLQLKAYREQQRTINDQRKDLFRQQFETTFFNNLSLLNDLNT